MDRKSGRLSWDGLRGRVQDAGAPPEAVDRLVELEGRRKFFGQVGRGGATLAMLGFFGAGTEAAMRGLFGRGLIPVAWAQEVTDDQARQALQETGKEGITVHNERPLNAEFGAHELADEITPINRHFIRNNGLIPQRAFQQDLQGWALEIDGEVNQPLKLTMEQIRNMPARTIQASLECGGNGRSLFDPPVRGNQWRQGAIGCSEWTGVSLGDVLREAGLRDSAVYTGHYGEDPPLAGDEVPISRGVPIDKAMEEHTLLAYQMNGEDLPAVHGFPLRIVVPGWVGSCSQKWLTRIWVRDQEHDGPKMLGYSYRMPAYPVAPGEDVPEEDMEVAKDWPIKSMITGPAEGSEHAAGAVTVTGHAWAGEHEVERVEVSIDFGNTWTEAELRDPANKYAWQQFEAEVELPGRGYYEIWARAFDDEGNGQPFRQPWNPRGYMGNVVHRVPVRVTA
ncbi:sulfite oxidase [Ectothiorhodospiraceae bacterium 2226]|nr:sulfite oxidase [Ectothiorhodospiraceae bacterium 2226]